MQFSIRRVAVGCGAMLSGVLFSIGALAQSWPQKPLRMVVPYSPTDRKSVV